MTTFMRNSDALSWYMERDPVLRSTVVAVVFLDAEPNWDRFVAKLDEATRRVPPFRQLVVETPGRIATPRWVVDDAFDLSWHLRRMEAPPPRTADVVLDVARREITSAFDPAHPLWTFTLIEHLTGGRAALVMKMHHSFTDGVGAMELALHLFDADLDAPAVGPTSPTPSSERLGPTQLVRQGLARQLELIMRSLEHQAQAAVPRSASVCLHPIRSAREAVDTLRSLGRAVAPANKTLSPVMTRRGLMRSLDVLEFPLADLKRAARTAGGSVNDGFVAGIVGGLRRYHQACRRPAERLRFTLPISIRKPSDPPGGNRITLMRLEVPVEADPVRRIETARNACKAAQSEPSLSYTDNIAGILNLLPAAVIGSMLKHIDFVASDVAGFDFPVYLVGTAVTNFISFSPTIGAALNLTLVSYKGTCSVGVAADSAAVPDHELLMTSLVGGFEEVLDLGGPHHPVRLPLTERSHRPDPPALVRTGPTKATPGVRATKRTRQVGVAAAGRSTTSL